MLCPECETRGWPVAGVRQAGRKRQSMASDELSVPTAAADTGERRTGKSTRGNDVAGALRAFQREHACTGIRIVYKIAI